MVRLMTKDDSIHVTVRGDFDFEAARDMLLKSKAQLKQTGLSKIDIHMDHVKSCNSCAIGAMVLLCEQAHDGFNVRLSNCNQDVHQLFDSDLFNKHFKVEHSPPKIENNPCTRCFNVNCKTPVPGCSLL